MPNRQASEASIRRAVRAAEKSNLTVYGVSVDGLKVTVLTQPFAGSDSENNTLDQYFDD